MKKIYILPIIGVILFVLYFIALYIMNVNGYGFTANYGYLIPSIIIIVFIIPSIIIFFKNYKKDTVNSSKNKKQKIIKQEVLKSNDSAIKTWKLYPENGSVGKLIIIIGIISCIVLFNAGFQISKGAVPMGTITSQAGDTITEAYYQDMGQVFKGFSYLCYGLGLGILGISISAGMKKIR